MKVTVTNKGVFIDGQKIDRVTQVDIKNLNLVEDMEVVLHIAASEIEVDYQTLSVRE